MQNVSRSFGQLVAVNSVTLNVEASELRAIIGPNGAGKTTFFNLISGFFAPTTGRIVFDGQDVTQLAVHKRVALGMARTFQITEIFPNLSVRENLRVPVEVALGLARRLRTTREEAARIDARVDELLELGGLSKHALRRAGELAHGDQRAIEIMMALALRPRLLLLDEPTAGMGHEETHAMADLIGRLHREQQLAIVLIEHDMQVIFRLAQRILVLAAGAVLADGTPDEIAANEAVQAAYLGEGK